MSEQAIFWALLAALAGWCGRQQWWIAQHHKSCHTKPTADLAALEQRVTSCEQESDRLAKNAHDDRNALTRALMWTEVLKEKAGIK